jgi:hypothetical protein
MTETAWVRFVRRLPRNRELIGEGPDLREFLFGSDRTALGTVHRVLRDAAVTERVALWAYGQAERAAATVWERGRDGMVALDPIRARGLTFRTRPTARSGGPYRATC